MYEGLGAGLAAVVVAHRSGPYLPVDGSLVSWVLAGELAQKGAG